MYQVDIKEAIETCSKAAQLISADFVLPYGSESVLLPGVGIGFSDKNEYQLVFHLNSEIQRTQAVELCEKLHQESAEIKITGRAFSLPSNANNTYPRTRPVSIGACVSRQQGPSGTLGCFVQKATDPSALLMMSCTHVFAPLNSGFRGDLIVQPGGSNSADDVIAKLDNFIPLTPISSSSTNESVPSLDAAIAEITCPDTLSHFNGSTLLRGEYAEDELPNLIRSGVRVFKIGSTTATTSGRVREINLARKIPYGESTICLYQNLFSIESDDLGKRFALPGDSGALIYDEDGYAAGLLVGGTDSGIVYALPIEPILNRLGISLVLN